MREIDQKFHVEGDEIIKTTNGEVLPDDEPLFLFRARDRLALTALRAFEAASQADGCTEYHMKGIWSAIDKFTKFQEKHSNRMKQPGISDGR